MDAEGRGMEVEDWGWKKRTWDGRLGMEAEGVGGGWKHRTENKTKQGMGIGLGTEAEKL